MPADLSISDSRPRIAVAVPAKDEAAYIPTCLAALDAAAGRFDGQVSIMVVANDCRDATHDMLGSERLRHAQLHWSAVSLLPGNRHAGWARRLAFDAAAALLAQPSDLLLSTDADTVVAPDWIVNAAAHLARGVTPSPAAR